MKGELSIYVSLVCVLDANNYCQVLCCFEVLRHGLRHIWISFNDRQVFWSCKEDTASGDLIFREIAYKKQTLILGKLVHIGASRERRASLILYKNSPPILLSLIHSSHYQIYITIHRVLFSFLAFLCVFFGSCYSRSIDLFAIQLNSIPSFILLFSRCSSTSSAHTSCFCPSRLALFNCQL